MVVGYFWHISEIHYHPTYWTEGISCHTDPGHVSTLGRFGHHFCDPPWTLVEEALDEMVRRKADPDFIVWTGDTSYHFSREQRSLAEAVDVIRNVSEAIAVRFPGMAVIPSIGNNDFVPKNLAGVKHSQQYS
ncbi:hypothetical protein RRG08_002088 [Elysia crispata]|uniref:Calcineurin-like phosphoesterase domain-containing protein n=1 Tax=Elysia crispata TaxID=231223 RepID=A0AAE0ZKT9_9GAST|nr:hypothetical protein RRG08_002088 [Elysia crispata]